MSAAIQKLSIMQSRLNYNTIQYNIRWALKDMNKVNLFLNTPLIANIGLTKLLIDAVAIA